MVETIRLESGHTLTGIGGSNPSLSARQSAAQRIALRSQTSGWSATGKVLRPPQLRRQISAARQVQDASSKVEPAIDNREALVRRCSLTSFILLLLNYASAALGNCISSRVPLFWIVEPG